jgi:hypothetical protein
MIKRDITETVYEYDKEGKLLKKTVTETHEEEENTITTYPSWGHLNDVVYCGDTISTTTTKCNCTNSISIAANDAHNTYTTATD